MPGQYDSHPPTRLSVGDARLNRVFRRENERLATVSEYADRAGIPVAHVANLLSEPLSQGALALEPCEDEIFVHTAPHGRPGPGRVPVAEPNLWESLRTAHGVDAAYVLWRTVRDLERAGWVVETRPERVLFGLRTPRYHPELGVRTPGTVAPLVLHPTQQELSDRDGVLTDLAAAGAAVVGVVCQSGSLGRTSSAVRKWAMSNPTGNDNLQVVTLEESRYQPTLLSPHDASVEPRSVSVATLD